MRLSYKTRKLIFLLPLRKSGLNIVTVTNLGVETKIYAKQLLSKKFFDRLNIKIIIMKNEELKKCDLN